MSRQITLEYSSAGRNTTDGGPLPPSPAVTSWASIRALQGDELDRADQIAQESDHIVIIPFQSPVTLDMIVVFEQRKFQIKYIEDQDELHFFLSLYCVEIGQNAGSQT
jgi:SPP1 family predicted phage head-tail adaptor